jgi:carbamoyltransferase
MPVLGLSAYYHDSAAALVADDGTILAAAQEERFTRRRHDPGFPLHAVRYCAGVAGLSPSEIHHVVFYELPLEKFGRIVDGYLALGRGGLRPFLKSFPLWLTGKLRLADEIAAGLSTALSTDVAWNRRLRFIEHHAAHAASAFFPSPFEEAAILTVDGVGERATATAGTGSKNSITIHREMHFPNSLGLLYSAFAYYLGFKVNSGEHKMMGLASYGSPTHAKLIRDHIIDIAADGSFRLNASYFDQFSNECIINTSFEQLLGGPRRLEHQPIEPRHINIAASIQEVVEDVLLRLARALRHDTGLPNLCLAGGVALNCVANGRVAGEGVFKRLFVQPAAGDAGGALGAALFYHCNELRRPRHGSRTGRDTMRGALLGPNFSDAEIESCLRQHRAEYEKLDQQKLIDRSARLLADGYTLAWFQGRMEFGPRALGSRSILADPRRPDMQERLNKKVKRRETFRPFAPAVLADRARDWFDLPQDSPHMLLVARVVGAGRSELRPSTFDPSGKTSATRVDIPAVTHVDGSARVQTVDGVDDPLFHALILRFGDITGCPMLVNTSFNVRGEPIVCTPEDALVCFMNTELDFLAIGSFLLTRERQDPILALRMARSFAPD